MYNKAVNNNRLCLALSVQLQVRLNKVIERNFVLTRTRFDQGLDLRANPRDEDVLARFVSVDILLITEHDKYNLKDHTHNVRKYLHLDGDFLMCGYLIWLEIRLDALKISRASAKD